MSIRRNTIYNLAGRLAPVAISLLTLPVYLNLIGEERYGVLSIAWLFLGYFGLFDLGLSQATAQRIATLKDATAGERAETFWTALTINVGFGILGGLLLWPVAHFFFVHHFKVDESLRSEIISAIPWLITAVPVATVSGVLTGSLQGRERFLSLNIIGVTGTAFFQIVPLLTTMLIGANLKWILPSVVLSRLITLVLLFVQVRHHVPLSGRPRFNRALIGPLFRFGGWVSVSGIISPLMTALDRFIIGAMVGAKAVTYYTVPYNLANRITLLPQSLTSALFPRLAAADSSERERLVADAVRVLLVLMTPVIIVGLFLIQPFLGWWIDTEFATEAASVGQIILLGLWANSLAIIPYVTLQAQGRPDLVAKAHLVEVLPYLAMLYIGLTHWGVAGAAWAWSLRVSLDALLLFILNGTARGLGKLFIMPTVLLSSAACSLWLAGSPTISLTAGLLTLAVCLLWCWRSLPATLSARLTKVLPKFNRPLKEEAP